MTQDADPNIDVETLDGLRRADPDFVVLDVREPWEREVCAIEGSIAVPMATLPDRLGMVPKDRPIAVLCHHGGRSLRVTLWLRSRGYGQAVNVAGGIDAWAAEIDPTMRRY